MPKIGADGLAEQKAIVDAARQSGVAVLGPNCLGFINHVDGVALCMALPQPRRDTNPSVGFIAQSGAMMLATVDVVRAKGIGYTHVVSTGNEAVIGIEDFLAALIEDEATRVITLFVEQIRRPLAFLALAARARERRKPIVMFHSGRTAASRAAALSHTGALAGDFKTMAALTAPRGGDPGRKLRRDDRCRGPAGAVSESANRGRRRDHQFRRVSRHHVRRLRTMPGSRFRHCRRRRWIGSPAISFPATENPIDVGTQLIRAPELLGTATQALLDDPHVGSVVAAIVLGSLRQAVDKARAAHRVMRDAAKPVAFGAIGGDAAPAEFFAEFDDHKVPLFRSPERALRAMARITNYGLALRRWEERDRAAPLVAIPPPSCPGRGTLPEYLGKAYLAALGIPVPHGRPRPQRHRGRRKSRRGSAIRSS